jgi:hypothetical protein
VVLSSGTDKFQSTESTGKGPGRAVWAVIRCPTDLVAYKHCTFICHPSHGLKLEVSIPMALVSGEGRFQTLSAVSLYPHLAEGARELSGSLL